MKGFRVRYTMVALMCFCLAFTAAAWADGEKERMLQRQPVIVDLKNKGIIGETNDGYLGYVSSQGASQDVVAGENQDRKAIYSQIAQQQNISVDLVAKRRAQQLIERTSPGHYYQNDSGAWVKK